MLYSICCGNGDTSGCNPFCLFIQQLEHDHDGGTRAGSLCLRVTDLPQLNRTTGQGLQPRVGCGENYPCQVIPAVFVLTSVILDHAQSWDQGRKLHGNSLMALSQLWPRA